MKKLLASARALFGATESKPTAPGVQLVDPNTILFTMPTLASDMAELEPVTEQPTDADVLFHEDEWRQVEFLPAAQLAEVQTLLHGYKTFEQAHRVPSGWRQVYLRTLPPLPVIHGDTALSALAGQLGSPIGPAPMLFTSNTLVGRMRHGFSLPLGGNVTLYGMTDAQGIPVLGALLGQGAENLKLTQAFMTLNAAHGLLLVDWRSQLVLKAVDADGQIEAWRP